MTNYEGYLRRSSRRLGLGMKPDGEIPPLKSIAIIFGVLLGVPLLASVLSPWVGVILRRLF